MGIDMYGMFYKVGNFNADLAGWDVSRVTDMSLMIVTSNFNVDISGWDVSRVTDMSYMFFNSGYFNFDISGWDVTGVENMKYMFYNTASFNQNMCGWKDQYQGSSNLFMFSGSSCPVQDQFVSENWCFQC